MQYGRQVTLLEEGILVSPGQLALIGGEASSCWGVWMHSWRETGQPAHLIVSPFHPETWCALFLIRIRLRNEPGTTHRIAELLVEQGFNILSQNSAQTGHDHATHNLVGTVPSVLTADHRSECESLAADGRTVTNNALREWASRKLAPVMLRKAQSIEEALIRGHVAGRKFLRDQTFPITTAIPGEGSGLPYEPRLLPEDLHQLGLEKSLKALRCHWLQYPAFFWLYGNLKKRILFTHEHGVLRPGTTKSQYLHGLKGLALPILALVSIDTRAQYLRLVISKGDALGQIGLTVDYETLDDSRGAIGVLETLTGEFKDSYSIRALWNSDLFFDWNPGEERARESGRLHIVVEPREDNDGSVEIEHVADAKSKLALAKPPPGVDFKNHDASLVGAKRVFVSTKFEWWTRKRPRFRRLLRGRLRNLGLVMTHANEEDLIVEEDRSSLTTRVHHKIGTSNAFIQVLPQVDDWETGRGLQWLMFELGIAMEKRLPILILLDVRTPDDKTKWRNLLKIHSELVRGVYDGTLEGEAILDQIEGGLRELAAKLMRL